MRTLLLNSWLMPDRIVGWQRAVVMVILGKVDVLEEYDEEIRSRSFALRAPAVVRLRRAGPKRKIPLRCNRLSLYTRDGFRCQYCGESRAPRDLNLDHVVPRSRGGRATWENLVTSCYACNGRKGNRTPQEAGMILRKKPIKPTSLSLYQATPFPRLSASEVPVSWLPFIQRGPPGHEATTGENGFSKCPRT